MTTEKSCFSSLAERMEQFRSATLYPVISSEFCRGRDPAEIFRMAAEAGAKLIQVREKNMSDSDLFRLVCQCRKIANSTRTLLIVDDRVDIALAANADGVHVGQDDLPVAAVKRIAPELIAGVSTHNAEEIRQAIADGADELNIGPVFPTQTKTLPMQALGLETLKELIPSVTIPFTVMGGIKDQHIPMLTALNVRRIALVTAVTQAENPGGAVRSLLAQIG